MPRSHSPNPLPPSVGTGPAADIGPVLLGIARATIEEELLGARIRTDESHPALHDEGACFVTLTTRGSLHGCIGTVVARRTLLADVRGNAYAAAFHDRRFPRLTVAELDDTVIDVSVLSASTPMHFTGEADALAQLRPHVDGVVLACGRRTSTFLPRVWDHVPEPEDFMALLKRKAGLPETFWNDEVRLSRYTVTEYHEGG
jgi:AmmeMemoRadiSam system protein A